MSSDPVVRVAGLAKCYRIYSRPVDRLREFVSLRRRKYHSEIWALKNISFTTENGSMNNDAVLAFPAEIDGIVSNNFPFIKRPAAEVPRV